MGRVFYRIRQFWNTLKSNPNPDDLEMVRNLLTPAQMDLFYRMQSSEQAHSIQVLKRICAVENFCADDQFKDLYIAALLHDVGKCRYRLRLWERVIIVLAKAFMPRKVAEWGAGKPSGWKRIFVISEQHPEWGAQMAAEAGTAPLAVELIRDHQNFYQDETVSIKGQFLKRLQVADQNS